MDTSLLNEARTGMFTFENYEEGSFLGNMLYQNKRYTREEPKSKFVDEF